MGREKKSDESVGMADEYSDPNERREFPTRTLNNRMTKEVEIDSGHGQAEQDPQGGQGQGHGRPTVVQAQPGDR